MKKVKNISLPLLLASTLFIVGCYKENTVIDGLIESKGKVAQISVFWVGDKKSTKENSVVTEVTVVGNTSVNCTIEYITEVTVKEFRLYTAPYDAKEKAIGEKTLVATVPIADAKVKFDKDLRNYVVVIPCIAPDKKGTTVVFSEIATINGLSSAQRSVRIITQ